MSGMHIAVDAIATRGLDEPRVVSAFLRVAANHAGMDIIGEQVHTLPNGVNAGPGVTAVVVIATSHGSVHTFPEIGRIAMDFYSCVEYEPMAVYQLFRDTFGVQGEPAIHIIERWGLS